MNNDNWQQVILRYILRKSRLRKWERSQAGLKVAFMVKFGCLLDMQRGYSWRSEWMFSSGEQPAHVPSFFLLLLPFYVTSCFQLLVISASWFVSCSYLLLISRYIILTSSLSCLALCALVVTLDTCCDAATRILVGLWVVTSRHR
jgi:hypothetical protein